MLQDTPHLPTADFLDRLATIVGGKYVLISEEDKAPYLVEWRGIYRGAALAVVRPNSTQEGADILRLANETGCQGVPQGGNTGRVGAEVPLQAQREIGLSVTRMGRIR